MIHHVEAGKTYGVSDFEESFPEMIVLAEFALGSWPLNLNRLKDSDIYASKGPYAYHDGICYRVCEFQNEAGAKEWVRTTREQYGLFEVFVDPSLGSETK